MRGVEILVIIIKYEKEILIKEVKKDILISLEGMV